MSGVFSLSPLPKGQVNPYPRIGFKRNPFESQDEDDQLGPLYTEHIQSQIDVISTWLSKSLTGTVQALSIKGTIGVGKTRLLKDLREAVLHAATEKRVHAILVFINKTGYSRPSVGQLLLDALVSFRPPWEAESPPAPSGVMPLIWSIIRAGKNSSRQSTMGNSINVIRQSEDSEAPARYLTRWLHRETLTPTQCDSIAIHGRIDYEGQLPDILCDLLSVAAELEVIKKLYFMVDQLEDLMTPDYSLLRQSRILTDLRTMVDKQDAGAPLAMVLSWSPDLSDPGAGAGRDRVDREMQTRYVALYSRLTRELVIIDKLREVHATGFAQQYIDGLGKPTNAERDERPSTSQLAVEAWEFLNRRGRFVDNTVTPRDLLDALSDVTTRRAHAAK